MQDCILGLVQMWSHPLSIDKNLETIHTICQTARQSHVDLLCFPELSVTGYHPDSVRIAQTIPGPASMALSQMATHCSLTLCAGITEKCTGNKPWITQLLCLPDGSIFQYRKTHLGRRETEIYSAGDKLLVFDTPKIRVGLALCWESHFPEVTSTLALSGAELLLFPHASPLEPPRRRESWTRTLSARAADWGIYVGCCNALGDSGRGFSFSGGAMAFGPKGEILSQHFSDKNDLLIVTLPSAPFYSLREEHGNLKKGVPFYPTYRRPELYHL